MGMKGQGEELRKKKAVNGPSKKTRQEDRLSSDRNIPIRARHMAGIDPRKSVRSKIDIAPFAHHSLIKDRRKVGAGFKSVMADRNNSFWELHRRQGREAREGREANLGD